VNYAFFFWLPFYLNNKFGWPQATADDISIWYDVGGIIGKCNGTQISRHRIPVNLQISHHIISLRGIVTLFAGGMESTTGYCPPVWDLLLALA
jgi:hypothetical protein